MNALHPKKLLLTKWTAVKSIDKNKHFLVLKVIEPELPETVVEWVELEAVYSKQLIRLAWRDLRDAYSGSRGGSEPVCKAYSVFHDTCYST